MAAKSGILGTIALVQESTLGGSTTGSIYGMRGVREWEFSLDSPQRSLKTNVWRLSGTHASVAKLYSGRLDMVLAPSEFMSLLMSSILTEKSATAIPPLATRVYRAERGELPSVKGLKFLAAYDGGPWLTFNGVVVEGLRFQVRTKQLPRLSLDWKALSLEETAVDPSWSIVSEDHVPCSPVDASATIGATLTDQLTEIGFEITSNLHAFGMANGVATGYRRSGPWQITGSVSELFDLGENIPDLIRTNTETSLNLTLPASDPIYGLEIDLPRIVFESGQPDPIGMDDSRGAYTYRVVHESALDTADEPLLTLKSPI